MIEHMTEDELILRIIKDMKELKQQDLQNLMEELQPYDMARVYLNLPEKHRHKMLSLLAPRQTAIVIQELEYDKQLDILHKLGLEKSSKVMDLMENDDLADLLNEMSVEQMEEFLSSMKKEESKNVQTLMSYPADTAGGMMTNRFVWIRSYYSVNEAIEKLRSFAEMAENIYYLYVIDEEKKLVGVVSYRDLLLARGDDRISDIMFHRVISVPVDMDQEEVARTIERYDFIAIPVVDHRGLLMGIITVDDVIDVFIEEANEDIGKLAASGKDIDFNTGAVTASARRLPWLIMLLLIGILSGSIISHFESTIEKVIALSFFMPMIAGMTGNTGTQSLAVVVRGLVATETNSKVITKLLLRELAVGGMIGITCGILIMLIAYFWHSLALGLVVGSSLFLTIILGTMAGTIIPLLLHKLKVDPAIASGPLITTLSDIFSLLVYFGTATMFLAYL